MEFDNRTLMVAVAVSSALCAAARFLLRSMHPGMPGLGHWAWASVLGACAAVIFASQPVLPQRLSGALAQTLILLGFAISWDGYRRFLGRKPLPLAALILGIVSVLAALGLAVESQTHRSLAGTLAIAALSAVIAWELLGPRTPRRLAMRATGWVYALNTLFFLARGATLLRGEQPLVLQWDSATAVALLWMLGLIVATTLGMVLMTGERLQEELDHQISRDPLTGALNRRAFALMAEKALAHCRRQGRPLALLVMDLDHFKQVNDRHGHAMGDLYLCRFVAVAGRILRGEDIVCRFGGEEFVALLPETSAPQAWSAAERLRAAFCDEIAADPTLPFAATVSIGIGQLAAGESLEDLMRRTDAALYQAKRNGRDRCEPAAPPQALAAQG